MTKASKHGMIYHRAHKQQPTRVRISVQLIFLIRFAEGEKMFEVVCDTAPVYA